MIAQFCIDFVQTKKKSIQTVNISPTAGI